MDDSNYSKLLLKVLEHSRTLDIGVKGSITPEKLLIAVLQLKNSGEIDRESQAELEQALATITKSMPNTEKAMDSLVGSASGSPEQAGVQAFYMSSVLSTAEAAVGDVPDSVVTLDVIVATIIEKPNEGVKKCLDEQKAPPKQDGGLDWLSGAIDAFKSGKSSPAKPEAPKAPADAAPVTVPQPQAETAAPAAAAITAEAVKEETAPADGPESVIRLVEKINGIRDNLLNTVYGQDHAIDVVTTGLFQGELLAMTDRERKRPQATFLFAGSPGVGKTYLAETMAEALQMDYKRFDMSEYAMASIGEDLFRHVKKHPKGVLLFDEIEKAHPTVIQTFLQVIDLGQLGGNDGVSLKDCILIFTTNAGRQMYEESDTGDFSDVPTKVVVSALRTDINDRTGEPYFPAPLCSRFESGNVVMFNRMQAHVLRRIAESEIRKQVNNLADANNIRIEIDDKVFSSLLFSEGGNTDARNVRASAEKFINNELYELYRLLGTEDAPKTMPSKIRIKANVPEDNAEIARLYRNDEQPDVLVFADETVSSRCCSLCPSVKFTDFRDVDQAIADMYKRDYKLVLIDFAYGRKNEACYLNDEDIESLGRDFFRAAREKFAEIPIYFLQTEGEHYNTEERLSLQRRGVRDVVELPADGGNFVKEITEICSQVYCQEMMNMLARSSKVLAFETGQRVFVGGEADIELFDFRLVKVIESEDAQAVLNDSELPQTRFKDVIGAGEAKDELALFVDFLKNPKQFAANGVETPKGVLLYGPPGTGKTMLARALAGEAGVAFLPVSASSFMNKYVGESAATVRRLFAKARKYAPSVIFIDEIDAIAKERTGSDMTHVEEQTLNELLTQLDGFKVDPKRPVFVLAATNFGVEDGGGGQFGRGLDPALLRRFDRRIKVDLPNQEDRIKYLKLKTEGAKFALTEQLYENIGKRSMGMSLAQLESIIKMAKRSASRKLADVIDDKLFEDAFEEFQSGEERKWSEEEILNTARHESGHAFAAWHCGEKPTYITIVSRGNYGGYVMRNTDENKFGYNRQELRNSIRISLAGRAAEIVYYGEEAGITTGPSSDLQHATRTALRMICSFGMSEKFGLAVTDGYANENGMLSPEIREEINGILNEEMKNAIDLIRANKPAIDALVEELLVKTHLNAEEMDAIFSQHAKQGE